MVALADSYGNSLRGRERQMLGAVVLGVVMLSEAGVSCPSGPAVMIRLFPNTSPVGWNLLALFHIQGTDFQTPSSTNG